MSDVELFELFYSSEIKNYIIEASQINGLQISVGELNTFVGILLLSSINIRNNQYEYWETDSLVNCPDISSAMSRNRFKEIKSKLKYSKPTDQNNIDKAWKVLEILQLFRNNIQQFGFFSTALSVAEMMVRFFGRTCLRHPHLVIHLNQFGLKSTGTVRRDRVKEKHVFQKKAPRGTYKVSHERNSGMNFVSVIDSKEVSILSTAAGARPITPDLVIHLNKFGLKSTGTVRSDRMCDRFKRGLYSFDSGWCESYHMSIANAVILKKPCKQDDEREMKTIELCKEVSREYLLKSRLDDLKSHRHE
ncbi:hypothetical protein TSAR_010853 [Trichomalopsis sarcophagae]|uniref:PiggyBac transposable element-derived protein domain-containing protein n=1 Tax=Trichomalopsis sarcophagae TaxID=543379 RepID=A0A232ER52_9HYME|nr:hypothetical protein TSAR_010853 [Trichomalopsis sarcophagae]